MKATVKDNVLYLELPLEKATRSKSGKSMLVYTTKGFTDVVGTDLRISIYVIGKK